MAALYHAYITDSLKYRLRTGIEPKPAFRIRFRLILNVRLPLTSGENPVEVANWEKVKNTGQDGGQGWREVQSPVQHSKGNRLLSIEKRYNQTGISLPYLPGRNQ